MTSPRGAELPPELPLASSNRAADHGAADSTQSGSSRALSTSLLERHRCDPSRFFSRQCGIPNPLRDLMPDLCRTHNGTPSTWRRDACARRWSSGRDPRVSGPQRLRPAESCGSSEPGARWASRPALQSLAKRQRWSRRRTGPRSGREPQSCLQCRSGDSRCAALAPLPNPRAQISTIRKRSSLTLSPTPTPLRGDRTRVGQRRAWRRF
jgi:hypothetical protein